MKPKLFPNAPEVVPGLVAGAAVLLALSLAISYGTFDPYALVLVTAAGGAALLASRLGLRGEPSAATNAPVIILGLGLGLSIIHNMLYLPGVLVDPARLGGYRPGLVAIAVLVASYLWKRAPQWFVRVRFPAILMIAAALGAVVILASPSPGIDVWHLLQGGAEALLSGKNPYSVLYPNIYGPGTLNIDPSLLSPDGRYVIATPFPPLTLLLVAPAAWIGDVRWATLAAMVFAALLIRKLGRGSVEAELAGTLLLLQPEGFFVLELSWTEPIALAAMLLFTLAIARFPDYGPPGQAGGRRSWLVAGFAAAVAASSKQYVPILLLPLFFALPAGVRVRTAIVALAGALALLVPFALGDPAGFFRSVVEFQFRQPFRHDALSWLAAITALGGPTLPSWPAFLLAGAALAATVRSSISPWQGLLSSAIVWLVLVAFNKQAFCNYYWLAVGLLCATLAALPRRDERSPSHQEKERK